LKKVRAAALQIAATVQISDAKAMMEYNLTWTLDRIKNLSEYGVDIICLPEAFTSGGTEAIGPDQAERVDGETLNAIRKLASELRIAIICPIIEKDGSQYFNTAFFIDRDGSIIGKYKKIHPTESELRVGIVPGNEDPTIISWEGIKTGVQTCFDANWPQDWLDLKKAGADIIFFCSAFSAGRLLESYAAILRIPIVAATWCPDCRIYDRCGRIIAHQSPYYPYVVADIQIKQPLFHLDFQTDKVESIRRQYRDISVDIHDGEGTWTINGDNLESIIDAHQLVDIDDYLRRAEKAQRESAH
jgi:beta-ureidopropionase